MSNPTNSSAADAGQVAPQARRPRMKWNHVYFLLAAFDVFTVSLSLCLNHQLVDTNKRTVQGNLQWVTRLKQCDELSKLASQVNAPGNDVLNTRDVPTESRLLTAAHSNFDQKLSTLHGELLHNIPPNNAVPLLNDCSLVGQEMDELIAQIDTVFSLMRTGKLDQIQPRIAQTSHEYDDVLRSLDELRSHLRAQREAYLQEQIAEASAWQRYEWLLAVLIVVMVIGIVVYGMRLDRHVSASEIQIREAQERYRLLVEQSTDGILIADDDWNIRFANQAACRMFGCTHEEIIRLNAADTYTPEDNHLVAGRKHAIRTGEGTSYERLVLRKDGSRFFAEVIVRRLDQGGSQAIFRDVSGRKRAEEARLRLAAIVESSDDAIVSTDLAGLVTSWNAAAERLYGYTAGEIIGQSIAQIIAEERRDEKENVLRRVCTGEHVSQFESFCIAKGGRSIPVSLAISPIKDASGNIVGTSAIIHDITERKRAEEQLRLQSAALEAAANAIVITDSHGSILWVNPAFTTLTGYTPEEVIGKNPNMLKSGNHDRDFYRELWETISAGRIWRGEIINRRKDGSLYTEETTITPVFDGNGKISRFIAIKQDVTARKRAEETQHDLQRQQRALLDNIPDLAWLKDKESRYVAVNESLSVAYGHSPEEIIGKTDFDMVPAELAEGYRADDKKVIESRQRKRVEEPFQDATGTRIWIDTIKSPILNDHGEVTGTVGIARDITERKRAEQVLEETNERLKHALEELQTAQQQVAQQERLRALGTMASGVAHDFNNALTAILGFSELLLSRPEMANDKTDAKSYLEMINTAARDAGNVVNRLREFYRHRDRGEVFAPVNLNYVVEETISLTQPKWKTQAEARGISIRAETDLQEVPPVLGNAADLREALTNLIFNAVDAMPRGGTVTIRTYSHNARVMLEVTDTGSGMTEEVRRRCLEPFFTTKGDRGTGLGLSMVYGIVQRHEGVVEIQTQLDEGSTVILSLPVQGQPQPTNKSIESAHTPLLSKNVLLIDDDAVVRKILNEYLTRDGHSVVLAADGKDGLHKFRNGRFDLVILDRAMPGMSGDQVGAAIKGSFPNMPVIMLTGFGSMMEAADEKPVGIDFVVSKPVTIDTLRRAVARALDLETSLPK